MGSSDSQQDGYGCSSDTACRDVFQRYCDNMKLEDMFENNSSIEVSTLDRVTIWVSIVVSCFQGVLILQSKRVRKTHPMGLIMALSFVQVAYFWDLAISDTACDLKLPQLYAKTVLWDASGSLTTEQENVKAIQILNKSSRFLRSFLWFTSVFINYNLMRDLILQLINPIEKTDKKIAISFSVTLLITLIFSIAGICGPSLDNKNPIVLIFYSYTITMFYASSLISIFLCLYLMGNLGMGKATKRLILFRHISVVVIYWICNLFVFYNIYLWNFDPDAQKRNEWYVKVMQGLFFSQGFILPLFRMLEPGSFKMNLSLMRRLLQRL